MLVTCHVVFGGVAPSQSRRTDSKEPALNRLGFRGICPLCHGQRVWNRLREAGQEGVLRRNQTAGQRKGTPGLHATRRGQTETGEHGVVAATTARIDHLPAVVVILVSRGGTRTRRLQLEGDATLTPSGKPGVGVFGEKSVRRRQVHIKGYNVGMEKNSEPILIICLLIKFNSHEMVCKCIHSTTNERCPW